MSFTNSTPNLHLPQWVGSDKPQFATDINNAFSTIDASVTNIKTQQDTTDEQFQQIKTDFEQIETDFTGLQQGVQNANNTANGAVSVANNAVNLANAITDWYETTLHPVTLMQPAADDRSFLHMHYNPALKLLTIEFNIGKQTTEEWKPLTNHIHFQLADSSYNAEMYPFCKLPFKADMESVVWLDRFIINVRSLTIDNVTFPSEFVYNGGIILNDDGFLYLGISSNTTTGITLLNTVSSISIINTTINLNGHFNNIQLTDWTKVS